MLKTEIQHVHTEPHWTGRMVLDKAEGLLPGIVREKILVDTIRIKPFCDCPIPPGWKTWMLIYYLIDETRTQE